MELKDRRGDGCMELKDRRGDLFSVVSKVRNVYPMELTAIAPGSVTAAWIEDMTSKEPTRQNIVARLGGDGCHGAGWKGFRGESVDLALSAGSSVTQGSVGSSSQWSEWYDHHNRTCNGARS